jgi:hypothetical protein
VELKRRELSPQTMADPRRLLIPEHSLVVDHVVTFLRLCRHNSDIAFGH